ncbi:MAG: hypothetical protein ACRBCS_08400 [Cellvibrionaceae bacterium]
MSDEEYIESEITDFDSIKQYIDTIDRRGSEMVLKDHGKTVGAILTAEQYEWFLDQLDSHQDLDSIVKRANDKAGSQDLESFKKEL